MSTSPSFEEYLVSKKIDSQAFRDTEPEVWMAWKKEFDLIHPSSFTVQKLNLINPVRRKYLLHSTEDTKPPEPPPPATPPTAKPGKPVMRPRPKMD